MAILGLVVTHNAGAFSLLGPYADWMDVAKGYRLPGDIGGPVALNEGYRWNVPVISYGFDRSFIDYFGSNGVAAVEEAIALLNAVPAASRIDVKSWPTNGWSYDPRLGTGYLQDLKSRAMGVLLGELGLADPMRYTWCIRDYAALVTNLTTEYAFYVIQRNYDPISTSPSTFVNGNLVSYQILQWFPTASPWGLHCEAREVFDLSQPHGLPGTSQFADWNWQLDQWSPHGGYLTNLTRDDVGGLMYLLRRNRVESLPADTHLAGTNGNTLVRTALRSGVDKLTFVRHPAGTLNGQFRPFTNAWTDYYTADGQWACQDVERVRTRPDMLFTAADLGPQVDVLSTSATNWINLADLNGNPGGAGPGVIQAPITISFNSGAPFMWNYGLVSTNAFLNQATEIRLLWWATLGATNGTITYYPEAQAGFRPSEVRFRLQLGSKTNEFHWSLPNPPFGRFLFQTSLDLAEWTTLRAMTNTGTNVACEFQAGTNQPARFFRTIRQ